MKLLRLADMWRLPRMRPPMRSHGVGRRERLAARLSHVGLLPRMHPHVLSQFTGRRAPHTSANDHHSKIPCTRAPHTIANAARVKLPERRGGPGDPIVYALGQTRLFTGVPRS